MKDTGNLTDFVVRHRNDQSAVIDYHDYSVPKYVSHAELDASIVLVANGLIAAGFATGDRVGILSTNRVEFLEVFFGCMRTGIIPVAINYSFPEKMVQFIVQDADINLVFTESKLQHLLPNSIPHVVFEETYNDFKIDDPSFESFIPASEDIAYQMYTSGSTGTPKGVLIDHLGHRFQLETMLSGKDIHSSDRGIVASPLHHKSGLLATKLLLASGGMVVLLPRFNISEYVRKIDQHKLTILNGLPTMLAMIFRKEKLLAGLDGSSVKTINIGGAPAHETLVDRIGKFFSNATVKLNYGLAEASTHLLSGRHPDGLLQPAMSIGFPSVGTELKLIGGVDENQGELYFHHPGMIVRYHKRPEETKDRIKDGWFRTGDVLRRDKDGWYYFVGRADDMFICAGNNLYPCAIETVLERHPCIVQAVVVPVPHETKNQVPYAFVVLQHDNCISEGDVKKFSNDNAPAYAQPRRIIFLDEIPLTGVGKVDKNKLMRESIDVQIAMANNLAPLQEF